MFRNEGRSEAKPPHPSASVLYLRTTVTTGTNSHVRDPFSAGGMMTLDKMYSSRQVGYKPHLPKIV